MPCFFAIAYNVDTVDTVNRFDSERRQCVQRLFHFCLNDFGESKMTTWRQVKEWDRDKRVETSAVCQNSIGIKQFIVNKTWCWEWADFILVHTKFKTFTIYKLLELEDFYLIHPKMMRYEMINLKLMMSALSIFHFCKSNCNIEFVSWYFFSSLDGKKFHVQTAGRKSCRQCGEYV